MDDAALRVQRLHGWATRIACGGADLKLHGFKTAAATRKARYLAQRPTLVMHAAAASACAGVLAPPSLQAYLDFELLWLRARNRHSLSRDAAGWALEDVRRGVLPCDAALLEARVQRVLEMGSWLPGVDARKLLNWHRLALRQDPSELEPAARQLLRLLPSQPPTQLLLATLSQLPHRSPESIALAISSLEPAVRRVLGSGLTGPLLDELLLCMDQGISSSTSSSGRSSSSRGSSRRGHNGSTAWLEERLAGIAALLGPELAHGALQLAPGLMRVSQEDLAARMGAISELLQQQQPVDAALLAGRHAQLLLLAPERLFEVGEELRDALGEWLGWPRGKALHFMVWNPHVLVEAAQQPLGGLENRGAGVKGGPSALDSMGMHWEEVRRLAARRERWKAAIGRARYPLVAAALCGNSSSSSGTGSGSSGGGSSSDLGAGADPAAQLQGGRGMESSADAIHDSFAAWVDAQEQRLQRLRYCAETGDLPLLGLRRVLLTHPVEFVSKCSGYRSWRLQQSRSGGGVEVGEGNEGLPAWWYEPQLEVLGELGPYDRL